MVGMISHSWPVISNIITDTDTEWVTAAEKAADPANLIFDFFYFILIHIWNQRGPRIRIICQFFPKILSLSLEMKCFCILEESESKIGQ